MVQGNKALLLDMASHDSTAGTTYGILSTAKHKALDGRPWALVGVKEVKEKEEK